MVLTAVSRFSTCLTTKIRGYGRLMIIIQSEVIQSFINSGLFSDMNRDSRCQPTTIMGFEHCSYLGQSWMGRNYIILESFGINGIIPYIYIYIYMYCIDYRWCIS